MMTVLKEGERLYGEGRVDEAAERFQQALRLEPASVEALNNLGVIAFQRNRADQAVDCFARALQIDRFHLDTILNYCCLLKSLGRLHQGLAILTAAVRRYPDNADIGRFLSEALQARRQVSAPESHCGAGSYVANTEEVRHFLESVIRRYNVESAIDVACGDWNWMRLVDLQGATYTGYDIDEGFIAENRRRYPQHQFIVADVLSADWPQVDLILCRDLMIHLSNDGVIKLLESFRRSGSTWLMATSYDYLEKNRDFTATEKGVRYSRERRASRQLNLEIDPYNLPRPVEFIRENRTVCQKRIVGLWELSPVRH